MTTSQRSLVAATGGFLIGSALVAYLQRMKKRASRSSQSRALSVSLESLTPTIARLALPDDANPAGNVHGGTILRMMEEAGMVCASRYVASKIADSNALAVLVRFETMSFYKPVFVGELVSVSAKPIFTSQHSILVQVVVSAETITKGQLTARVTNTGELWYVPFVPTGKQQHFQAACSRSSFTTIDVPPLKVPTEDPKALQDYQRAQGLYQTRKAEQAAAPNKATTTTPDCLQIPGCLCPNCRISYSPAKNARSPSQSQQRLSQMVLPGDCGGSIAFGGFVMKLMDNAAGCSAFRHCRTNVVTVAISTMDFVDFVHLGDICTIQSQVVFCSNKTMDIEVTASAASMHQTQDVTVAKARFTFCSLDSKGRSLAVPPLLLETPQDMDRAFLGQVRYETAKRARMEAAKPTTDQES